MKYYAKFPNRRKWHRMLYVKGGRVLVWCGLVIARARIIGKDIGVPVERCGNCVRAGGFKGEPSGVVN